MNTEYHNSKDKWIDDVMHSIDHLSPAEPKVQLFDQICNKIAQETPKKSKLPTRNLVPRKNLKWFATAACVVIALNIFVFRAQLKRNATLYAATTSDIELFDNFSLYN